MLQVFRLVLHSSARHPICKKRSQCRSVLRVRLQGLPQRLDTPFSPANGLLTANGRPKRDAILARYREHFSEPVNA